MQANSPLLIKAISVFFIIYGTLDVGGNLMPAEAEITTVWMSAPVRLMQPTSLGEYSLPFLGIVLLLSGIGMLLLKKWALNVATFGCIFAITISIIFLLHSSNFERFIGVIFICLFALIFMYLTRSSIQKHFTG